MGGRRVSHTRGKVLGGSSSINGMIFQRGNPLDYERWAADPGMDHWDYAHCLPYFKRMENCLAADPDDEFRGHDGPLELERGPATNPLFDAFFAAAQQAGYPLTEDVNGFRQEGFARFDRNVRRGRRLSAARAYLHPVLDRENLDVITRATVMRVLFEGTTATGVEYRSAFGRTKRVRADEVILCGGAFNSPQLLQVSGVGPADHLRSLGIDVSPRPGGCRPEPAGPPGSVRPARCPGAGVAEPAAEVAAPPAGGAALAVPPRSRGVEPLRRRWVRAQQRRGPLPEPDVPLPAHRRALRRLLARRRPRLPGAHRPDVQRRARQRDDHLARRPGETGASLQLPVHVDRSAGVGGGDPGGPQHPRPAGLRRVQRR